MKPSLTFPVRRSGARLLLELDLARGLLESPPSSPVEALRAMHVPSLRSVVEALHRAARDERVVGLVAHVGAKQPSLAQSNELRAAVAEMRAAGKPTVCWSETFGEMSPGNVGYHLASAFDEIWLQPSGDVGLVGITARATFVRDALDKLGVKPEFAQRHEYKSAADTFLRSSMTEANREMLTRLVESAMDTVVRDVATGRGVAESDVRAAVEVAPLSPEEAVSRGLVDRIGYRDEVYDDLRGRLGEVELKFVERYGKGGLSQAEAALKRRGKPVVALIHAAGPIHLGRSSSSPMSGRSIGSDTVAAALRTVAADDSVKAVVLRVDSPGGSYVASDAIRREVIALRRTGRPVVASMANVAASGGYYIAMPADRVLASAGTITGSIGVLAGKAVIRETLERMGIRRESVVEGRYADMFSTDRPFDESEWARLEGWLDRVYDDFTAKAAEDRGMPVDDLRALARGRVWTGADAVERGLVDELGGLERAIDVAATRAGVSRAEVEVRVMPKPKLFERLMPADNSESPTAGASLSFGEGMPLLDRFLATTGLAPYGVLSMPVDWRLQ
ncbi:MAG TPA: signal peptide peptidase SppA [Nocardioidaceae bacterium]|nr:signal peptide peptidase SppA [Nocardioidaceae bacterium]